jgi:hypothetical protein
MLLPAGVSKRMRERMPLRPEEEVPPLDMGQSLPDRWHSMCKEGIGVATKE